MLVLVHLQQHLAPVAADDEIDASAVCAPLGAENNPLLPVERQARLAQECGHLLLPMFPPGQAALCVEAFAVSVQVTFLSECSSAAVNIAE
eukprot:5238171-Karenia_brevis.AAC.2